MADAGGLHREMFDVVLARDFDRLSELFHPSYTYTGPDGVARKGASAALEVAQMYTTAFPDLSFEFLNQITKGNTSIIEFRATGTHTGPLGEVAPTGKPVSVVACNIVTCDGDWIVTEHEYFDEASLLRQLGLQPGEGSP